MVPVPFLLEFPLYLYQDDRDDNSKIKIGSGGDTGASFSGCPGFIMILGKGTFI